MAPAIDRPGHPTDVGHTYLFINIYFYISQSIIHFILAWMPSDCICGPPRGATTSEKLRGTKVWVPTLVRLRPAPGQARLFVGCGRGSSPSAVRVRGYHSRKIFENSDAKSCILVTICCEISCFLKTTAKKLGDQLLVPQPKSWGTSLPRSPRLLRLRGLRLRLRLQTQLWF